MTWFENIVRQVNEAYGTERTADNIKFVPRYETAFKPGDTVFYLRNTGRERAYFYGTVVKVENGIVYYREKDSNGVESEKVRSRAYNNGDLYHCLSWLKPVRESGAWQYKSDQYKVGYETSNNLKLSLKHHPKEGDELHAVEDGKTFIVIHWLKFGFKEYYEYNTGEFVGGVNVGAMHSSNTLVAGKMGEAEPTSVYKDKYNPSQYGVIPEEFQNSAVLKIGNKKAWNFKHVLGIGYVCPWLRNMDAPWSEPGADTVRVCNPFKNPDIQAKMAELGM